MAHRIALALILTVAFSGHASAQFSKLKKLKEAAKKAAETVDSTAKRADEAKAGPAAASGGAAAATPASSAKVWENYDFVPGSKVMFFTDFSEDKVGNFARRLKYGSGPVEIVERDGVKMLRASGTSEFLIPIGGTLPEKFTLEFDVISTGSMMNRAVSFEGGQHPDGGAQSACVTWNPMGSWIQGSGRNMSNSSVNVGEAMQKSLSGNLVHVRVLMDGAYFKMYVNERRLHNIPELAFRRDSVIRVLTDGTEQQPVFFGSIRVAESETDVLYDALANKGRWATQGILFATGKADVQPESRPVLKEIASTMKEHAELKILIEGHTDNVGNAAANLTLSDARAAAVRAALVSGFGADGARITTKGFGDTKPVKPNTSAEGRAQNRRVEIVKQ